MGIQTIVSVRNNVLMHVQGSPNYRGLRKTAVFTPSHQMKVQRGMLTLIWQFRDIGEVK